MSISLDIIVSLLFVDNESIVGIMTINEFQLKWYTIGSGNDNAE